MSYKMERVILYFCGAFQVLSHMLVLFLVIMFADELLKVHKLKPNQNWRLHFENYLKTIPVYYAAVSVAV